MARDVNELIVEFKFRAEKARRQIPKTTSMLGRLRQSTSGMRREIGGLRNDLLLMSFAFAGVTAAIGKLVGVSAKFESVKTRLVGLTGSVENAEKAFDNFNRIAAQTPFSLEDVVDAGAQLEAFGADSDALIGSITDLASFMGTTAVEAANAFGRAFAGGAGAADILRERGILNIIKTSQGLEDLSKTTLPDFRKALISAMQDPVVGIAGSADRLSETFQGLISNTGDSFTRLADSVGDILIPAFTPLIKRLKEGAESAEVFFRRIVETDLETSIRQLKEMGASLEQIATLQEAQLLANLLELEEQQRKLNIEGKTSTEIFSEISQLNENILESQVKVADKNAESVRNQERILELDAGIANLRQSIKEAHEGTLDVSDDELKLIREAVANHEIERSFLETKARIISENFDFAQRDLSTHKNTVSELSEQARILQRIEAIREKLFGVKAPKKEDTSLVKVMEVDEAGAKLAELRRTAAGFFKETKEDPKDDRLKALAQRAEFFVQAKQEFEELGGEFLEGTEVDDNFFVKALEDIQTELDKTTEGFNKLGIAIAEGDMKRAQEELRSAVEPFKEFGDAIGQAVIYGQSLGDAVVNSIKAIAAELVAQAATLGLMKVFFGTGVTAAGLGLDLLGGIGKLFGFHQGGMIGGQGQNVPIIAQPGEFVMQRSAVQSIGASNLAEMNATGQPTSNVTVNIQGGVVDQDFVRNQLVPALNKEGARIAVV